MTDELVLQPRLGHSAAVVKLFAGNLVVTIGNLLRDVAIATVFGASLATDRFFLAVSLPIFLLSVASGAFRSVVVPLLTRILVQGRTVFRRVARRLTYMSILGIASVTSLLAIVGCGLYVLSNTVGSNSWKALLLVGVLVLPMYFLAAFVELSQGVLQTRERLFWPNVMRVCMPLGLILGAFLFGGRIGVLALIPGGTIGALVGAGVIAALLSREGMWPSSASERLPTELQRDVSANFRALVTATSITYLSPLIGQWMAGALGAGAVSYLGYANRLSTGMIVLVTSSLSPVLLSLYATQIAVGGIEGVRNTFAALSRAFAWAGCAMTLGTWLISDYLVSLVYQRGEFTVADAQAVRTLVDCYALGFPMLLSALAANTLISAMARNRAFVPIGIVLLVATLLGNLALMRLIGVAGIALASSLVYGLSLLLLDAYLHKYAGLALSAGEWLQIAAPFGALALAGIAPFCWSVRMTSEFSIQELLMSGAVLGIFLVLAGTANRELLRPYLVTLLTRSRSLRG